MSYGDIMDEIEADAQARQDEMMARTRARAAMDYQLAQLIGIAANAPKQYPTSLERAYPNLFRASANPLPAEDWRAVKERMTSFAAAHNAVYRAKKAGDVDDG